MAAAFASIATATADENNDDATSLTITKPSSLAEGDFMVAIFGHNNPSGTGNVTKSGWDSILGVNDGAARILTILSRVATSGDAGASDFTFTVGGLEARNICGAILRITGSGFTGSGNVTATDNDTSASATPTYTGGIVPGSVNTLLIMGAMAESGTLRTTSGYAVANSNPSWTERADFQESGGTSGVMLAIATSIFSVATTTGDYSLTFSGAIDSIGFIISVQETTNVTVSPSVISFTASVQAPAVSADANVAPAVISVTTSVQAPTLTQAASKWKNNAKSDTSPTITNTSKS